MNIPTFPILAFDTNGQFGVIESPQRYATLDYNSWRRKKIKGRRIIDSEGREFIVAGARKIGFPGFFRGYSLMRKRAVLVEFDYVQPSRQVPLDELKEFVLQCIQRDRSSWEATDLGEFKKAIQVAASHRELIQVF